MLKEVISFQNKLSLSAQDFEREKLIHFQNLLKHRPQNHSLIDIHTILKLFYGGFRKLA